MLCAFNKVLVTTVLHTGGDDGRHGVFNPLQHNKPRN